MAGRERKRKAIAVPAKIAAPRPAEMYRRERLFRSLDVARRKPIVWIAAPAGAGKTSLIATYLEARRLPALWYHVDARDADSATLFHYLAQAARIASQGRKVTLPTLASEGPVAVGPFARRFFEALCMHRPIPSAVVFDDYQEARSDRFAEVICELLAALPRGISAILLSRTEPPPPLARRVASGDVGLIGWDELRLTDREVAGLARLYGRDLGAPRLREVLPRISELANGWAAALVLLLRSARVSDVETHEVDGAQERLFHYFAAEILDEIDPPLRDFLLKTSVTPSLTAALAKRLSGSANAGTILSDLDHRSFLTQRLGNSATYRYHPLWRAFLQRRAESELGAPRLRELHGIAADALIEAGAIDEALEHLEQADDVGGRASLLARVAPLYLAQGRGHTIELWIGRLPVETVARSGWLSYWQAVCGLGHSPSRSRELLECAHARFVEDEDAAGLYSSCATALQAIVHEGIDFSRLDIWVERLETLHRSGPLCPPPLEPKVATGMILALSFRRPGTPQSREWADRAMLLAPRSEDPSHLVMTGGALAIYLVLFGDLGQAAAIVEMLRTSARTDRSPSLSLLTLLEGESICAWISGDNNACLGIVREGLAAADRTGVLVWNDYLRALGAAAALGMEDFEAARAFLEPMAEAAQRGGNFSKGNYHFYASWDALLRGDHARAVRSAELSQRHADVLGYPFARAVTRLATAQVLAEIGRSREADSHLQEARQLAQEMGSLLVVHACELVESDFAWESDRSRALGCLRRGLGIARERGYHNMFWLRESTMARVAVRALEEQIEPDHVRAIVTRRRLTPKAPPVGVEGWPWRLRVRALGSFEIVHGEVAHTPSRRRTEDNGPALRGMPLRLIQAIVTFGARGVPRTKLVDALWPDTDGDAARRVFDTTLHRLRKHLGDERLLQLADERVSLDERLCWIDVWALRSAVEEAERGLRDVVSVDDLESRSRRLLGIYRGPLLSDEHAAGDWVVGPRERLAATFRRAVLGLGGALERTGQLVEGAALYQRGLEGDPLSEALCAGLMRCLAGLGRRAEALRLFDRHRAALRESLDAEPAFELRDLRARVAASR